MLAPYLRFVHEIRPKGAHALSCPSLGGEEACVWTGLESRLKAVDVILTDNVLVPISAMGISCSFTA